MEGPVTNLILAMMYASVQNTVTEVGVKNATQVIITL